MASIGNISKITLPSGDEYDLKVRADNVAPIVSKSYTEVLASANTDPNGWLYFAKIFPDQNNYYIQWRVKYRFTVNMTGVTDGSQYCEVIIVGSKNYYQAYRVWNGVTNTSYRPIYGHLYYSATQTGVENGIGHALGVRLQSAYNPTTAKRNFNFEVIEAENCTLSFLDSMVTYANLPGTGSTNYQTRTSFDGTTQGVTISGDRNTVTNIQAASETLPVGTNNAYTVTLLLEKSDGTWESLVLSSSASQTGKQANPSGFKLNTIYYYSGATKNSGDRTTTSLFLATNAIDIRYSVNGVTSSASTSELVNYKPFYLVGTIGNDGLFYLDTTKWWAQDLPDQNDNKVYVYIGRSVSVYQVSLHPEHPIFRWHNGKWKSDWDLNNLAFANNVSTTYQPAGTVSKPTFTGTSATISIPITAAGSVSKPNIDVTPTTVNVSKLSTGGTVPSLTMTVDNNQVLVFSWSAGSMPTFNNQAVVTGISAALHEAPTFTGSSVSGSTTYIPAGTVSQPTFTGTSATLISS